LSAVRNLVPNLTIEQKLVTFLTFILVLTFSSQLVATVFDIVSVSESEVVLHYKLSEYELNTVEYEGVKYSKIEGDFVNYHSKEGYPKLPYFTDNVGIPVDGSIGLSVRKVVSETVANISVYPAERMVVEDMEADFVFYRDPAAYSSAAEYPLQILHNGVTAFVGDRRFASFVFNPFRYNAHNKELTIIKEAEIVINIRGNMSVSRTTFTGRNYIDKAGDSFFINNEFSQYWRKELQPSNDYHNTRNSLGDEIQFVVDTEGIYKVTYEQIENALKEWEEELEYKPDFDLKRIDPRKLQLENQHGVVPIHFVGERDGSFDPGDYFEFYGDRHYGKDGYYDTFTSENIYTLKLVEDLGARMAVESGGIKEPCLLSPNSLGARMAVESGGIKETNPREYVLPVSYEYTAHFEQQSAYSKLGTYRRQYREDLWFWKTIRAPELDVTKFELEYPHQTHLRTFDATVCLVGSTDMQQSINDHHARVRINSSFIDDQRWSGQSDKIFVNTQPLPNQSLTHGANHLYIDMPGDTPSGNLEAIFLDYFTIKYWREYKTDKNYIKIAPPSNRPLGLYQFEIENFTDEDVSVYKINSSVMENIQITPFSEAGVAPYTITFQDDVVSYEIEYIVLSEAMKKKPKRIRPRYASDLRNPSNVADYVIITAREFVDDEGTQLFKDTWSNEGYLVKVVDVQNIFDEFNHGIRSDQAIKDFLTYAYNNWSIPMTHVLLLGKGLYDERDHSVNRKYNHIPFHRVWTYKVGATPSDNWFACIVGDDMVPDLHIARLTVWEAEQILPLAKKTVQYLNDPDTRWKTRVTLTAGGKVSDGNDIFAQQSENIRRRWIPENYDVLRVYSNTQTVSKEYQGGTFQLKDSWNSGTSYLQFMGHGGGRIWADYNLLNNNDVRTLNNDKYPFVNSLSCYPADFSVSGTGSIGESMVITPNRGAIAHLGFTGMGYLIEDLTVGYHTTEAIFHRYLDTFGEIASYTKAKTYATILNEYPQTALTECSVLFADPMLGFSLPKDKVEVELNKYNITEGDTLKITVNMGNDIRFARFMIQNSDEITQNIPYDMPVINGVFETEYKVPDSNLNNYSRIVKVYGFGDGKTVIGMANYSVGKSSFANYGTIPESPTYADSIYISANIFDTNGVKEAKCILGSEERKMHYDAKLNKYITESPFPPAKAGSFSRYRFVLTTDNDQTVESEEYVFRVLGPDLEVTNIEFSSYKGKPAMKVWVKNYGEVEAPASSFKYYKRVSNIDELIGEKDFAPLGAMEERIEYLPFEPLQGSVRLKAEINPDRTFDEISYTNNTITSSVYDFNMFYAGKNSIVTNSLDNNLKIEIPANLFAEDIIFFADKVSTRTVNNQPDIDGIVLTDKSASTAYHIGVYDETVLADTLGTLPPNKRIKLTFNYDGDDENNKKWEEENSFSFYKWVDVYNKWLHRGGFTSTSNNTVFQELDKLGVYTILRNDDKISPTVTANVQEQEFTYGGYVSGSGIISLVLSDANGIDVFEKGIELDINGDLVDESDYTIGVNPDNLTSVPLKYQLNLKAGDYSLRVSCADVNGNYATHNINFIVNNKFDAINLANYPNPVSTETIDPINQNRTRFTYVLTDDADSVTLKIYTVKGRLVKTFHSLPAGVGYHEYPRTVYGWDCKDDNGVYLSNGVYFYKLIAKKGKKTIEKTQRMAIVR